MDTNTMIVTVFGTIGTMYAAYVSIQLAKVSKSQTLNSVKIDAVADDTRRIEKATNSMKDALVLATDKEAHGRGVAEEKARGEATADELIKATHDKRKTKGE